MNNISQNLIQMTACYIIFINKRNYNNIQHQKKMEIMLKRMRSGRF